MIWNPSRQGRSVMLVVAILLAGVFPTAGQETPPSRYRETTTVTLIEVPVVVLQGGTPVRDLSAEDFVLEQDGVEQAIVGFEQIDLSVGRVAGEPKVEQPMSLAGRRYFLLAFDLSHTQPANARRSVEAARELVNGGLHPTDLVGVSIYSAVAGARLLHPFTSNKTQLESALLAVEAVTSRDPEVIDQARATLEATEGDTAAELVRFLEEIRVFATQQGAGLASTTGPAGEWLDGYDTSGRGAVMAETLADMEAFHQEDILYITRDRSFDLLETLADLATALQEVRGQKYFVLFSEGIDQSFFEDYANTQGLKKLSELLKSFRRSGWVMHSVNVAHGAGIERGMFALVSETDGHEYRDFDRLDQAMGRMLEQTSVSYVLSFQPEGLTPDGTYHDLEVRLRKPGGAKVRHRDGFFAPLAQDEGTKEEDYLVAVADRVASEKEGGPFKVTVLAASFKHDGDTAVVRTIVEIEGRGLLLDRDENLLPLEIETYLLDDELGAVALSNRLLTLDVAKQGELVRGGGVKVLEQHLLCPGEHHIRVAVVDRDRRRRSVAAARVTVPNYETGEPQALEAFFPELSRNWLVVRETEETSGCGTPTPFQFGGRQFVPRAEVQLTPGEVVPIFILAFDLPEPSPELELELIAADGTRPTTGSLKVVSEPERTDDGLFRVMAELDTTGLVSGEYEIRVGYGGGANGPGSTISRALEIR